MTHNESTILNTALRRIVLLVALLNLGYFGIEFAVALSIGSASLLADSADFLEDASVNIPIFFVLAWTARCRAVVGMVMELILPVPALAFLWTAWHKFLNPAHPEALALTVTGLGALVVSSDQNLPGKEAIT